MFPNTVFIFSGRKRRYGKQNIRMTILPDTNPAHFARDVIKAALEYITLPDPPDEEFYRQQAACFVSIKKDGNLRGCIGTLEPAEKDLGQEILRNAQSAAFGDPRFPGVTAEEFDHLNFSVDVLSKPEEVDSAGELDCKRYGVIVSCEYRRGVLLPDLEGVDSIEHQLGIACQKAGIDPKDKFAIQRFTVSRFDEGWQPGVDPAGGRAC
ncbi:MAG: AmmeMemoRadiSam system protein A [Thermoleophilia bacterium]|nr:AmmeMemoRadiSam system protein A [Thermoleophilia bacterium]